MTVQRKRPPILPSRGAMAVADFVLRPDCTPIRVAAAPVATGQTEPERHRQRGLAWGREARRRGFEVLDLDALWGTGDSPNAYRLEYNGGDRTRPNDSACAAAVLAPILRRIIGE